MENGEWGIRAQLCAYLAHERFELRRLTATADLHSTLRFPLSTFRFLTGLGP
jgi:hypothetical protein